MKREPKWHNHPGWYLVMPILPLLIFVTVEDNAITRFLLASALVLSAIQLVLSAIQYGRETAKRASAKTDSDPGITANQTPPTA
ncbi:hypothetical protein [Streptomyces sp. NPDC001275]